MADFSKPIQVRPNIPNPKIAKMVPFAKLDEDRKEEYGAFIKSVSEDNPSLEASSEEDEPTAFTAPPVEETKIDDIDKQSFLRCILGGKEFTKTYTLFGSIQATFKDRSVKETEAMYADFAKHIRDSSIQLSTDEEWLVWLDRYLLATDLIKLEGMDVEKSTDVFIFVNNL